MAISHLIRIMAATIMARIMVRTSKRLIILNWLRR
jgi:hypothetical protein